MKNYNFQKRDIPGEYFPLPKAIFNLDLSTGEIAVYAFLMYCEDRKTFQCHPSYATIGKATGMSKNTVKKYVESLEKKGFIRTEQTKVKTKDGRVHNGSLLRLRIKPRLKSTQRSLPRLSFCREWMRAHSVRTHISMMPPRVY